jgi:hypothetical protein
MIVHSRTIQCNFNVGFLRTAEKAVAKTCTWLRRITIRRRNCEARPPPSDAVRLNGLDNALLTLLAKRLARALLLTEDEDGRDTDCETGEFTETL